jgi:hypothetical protein
MPISALNFSTSSESLGSVFPSWRASFVNALKRGLVITAIVLGIPNGAKAQEARSWGPQNSPYVFKGFDCEKEKVRSLVITGNIELRHPDDSPTLGAPPEIIIKCPEIFFAENSLVVSNASLRITGDKTMGGFITIQTTRSRTGEAGQRNEDSYIERAKPDQPRAADGPNGDHASDSITDGRGSGEGGRGSDGARGLDGSIGLKGNDGRPATKAARILLYSRNYQANTIVSLTSTGADGGDGQQGGRGENGGKGGDAGNGGGGGNSSFLKSASRGGDGGNGGDGGTGGTGGTGGNGGDAADGGDLYVLVIVSDPAKPGSPPGQYIWSNEGGRGGYPGLGGQGGFGGAGGAGGKGGCGGRPKKIGDWQLQPGARCGGQGLDGKRGLDGGSGQAGVFGADGKRGKQGTNDMAYIKDPALAWLLDWSTSPVALKQDPGLDLLPATQFARREAP